MFLKYQIQNTKIQSLKTKMGLQGWLSYSSRGAGFGFQNTHSGSQPSLWAPGAFDAHAGKIFIYTK